MSSGISIGRRFTMRKVVKTTYNNLGTKFTWYSRVIEAFDLYPTKGWRFAKRYVEQLMKTDWRRLPWFESEFIPNPDMPRRPFGRLNNTGWWRRNADLSPLLITERMLMRHGWYRRHLRKHGIAIDANAKNAMVLR